MAKAGVKGMSEAVGSMRALVAEMEAARAKVRPNEELARWTASAWRAYQRRRQGAVQREIETARKALPR